MAVHGCLWCSGVYGGVYGVGAMPGGLWCIVMGCGGVGDESGRAEGEDVDG